MVTAHFCPVYVALFLTPTKSLSLAFGLQEDIFVAIFYISEWLFFGIFWHTFCLYIFSTSIPTWDL